MAEAPSVWRQRDFLKLWSGQAVSQIGSHISREGLPLTAVLVLGASPWQMGILNGAGAAAVLLFGLFAGAWVDRLRRRPLLLASDFCRALLLATIPLAAFLHRLTFLQLCAVAAIDGVLATLFYIAYRTYVPTLVGPGAILDANSKLALTESSAEVIGPGLTGVLVQWLTAPMAIAFDALSFLASMASVWWIHAPEPQPQRAADPDILREIREGLEVCRRDPLLRALMLRTLFGAFFVGFASLYILYVVRDLHLNAAQLGLVISLGGGASLIGALFAQRLVRRIGLGPAMIAGYLTVGFACLIPSMAHGSVMMCCAILGLAQLGDVAWPVVNICDQTLCQAVAAPAVLGRVNSTMHLIFRGVLPVGALVGGAVATAIGLRATIALGGAGFLLSSLFLLFSPIKSLRELPKRLNG
jgi:predicted MFS family arabinose efflux permease